MSQNFTNDAAEQGGTFYSDARPVEGGHAESTAFSISYNATTQSYTVTAGSRTQTFSAADEVDSGSSDFIAYQKSAGSLHESLSLTVPGTSGDLNYQYVGGGAWERVVIGGDTLQFTYNPFTYGIVTPDADLKRTGYGLYSVSLVGARMSELPYAMAGSGSLQVDFGNSELSTSGVLTTIDVGTGYILNLGIFYGSATLSSTENSFSGAFAMDDGTRFTGGWNGRFYGPSNEEVGATWYFSNEEGEYGAGWLIGRQDETLSYYNGSLDPIVFSEEFQHRYSDLTFHDNGDGTTTAWATVLRSDATLSANVDDGSFHYVDETQSIDTTFAASDFDAGRSNSRFKVYRMTGLDGIDYTLSVSVAGATNPDIQLSYVSFGRWQQAQSVSADARDRWFAWGVRTNAFQIPTGTGHFDGLIVGSGASLKGGAMFSLSGTSTFDLDFGAGTFTGALHPIGTNLSTMATRDFGAYNLDGGLMDLDGGLSASVISGTNEYLGFFEGALFGPTATELGGTFGFNSETWPTWSGPGVNAVLLSGAVVAKKTD